MVAKKVSMYGLSSIPIIKEGDNLGDIIVENTKLDDIPISNGDVIVIAQKVVSIAEGAIVDLKDITPSEKAIELSNKTGRDSRLCQVYLNESDEIIEVKGRMVITRHRLGFECSGAGVDRSNIAPLVEEKVVLLPRDPDISAMKIRKDIFLRTKQNVAVIINDSFGRADRDGSVGTAIGISGINFIDERKQEDLYGNPSNSRIGLIDELSAAASVLMGQANEKIPVVLIKGVQYQRSENSRIQDILFYNKQNKR